MARLHKVKRNEGEITVEVLHKGAIVNGVFVPAGHVKVVSGVNHETYKIDPETLSIGYKLKDSPALLDELIVANNKNPQIVAMLKKLRDGR